MIDETKDPIYPEHKNHWQAYFRPKPIFPEYAITPQNIQLGIKIFGEGLLPVSDTISDACPVVAIPCGEGDGSQTDTATLDGQGVCQCGADGNGTPLVYLSTFSGSRNLNDEVRTYEDVCLVPCGATPDVGA